MKTPFILRILLVGIFSAALSSCATHRRAGASMVSGSWTNALGTVWTLNDNGTFDVDLNHDGKRDAWGTFTVERDILTITEVGGMAAKGCKKNGVYRFTRSRDTMRFHLVHDNCRLRVKNVMLLWRRK